MLPSYTAHKDYIRPQQFEWDIKLRPEVTSAIYKHNQDIKEQWSKDLFEATVCYDVYTYLPEQRWYYMMYLAPDGTLLPKSA